MSTFLLCLFWFMVGGTLGVLMMALFCASKENDEGNQRERAERYSSPDA